MNAFVWLLKREYWENKGGFLRAPMITSAILLLLLLIGLLAAAMHLENFHIQIGNFNLNKIIVLASQKEQRLVAQSITVGLSGFSMMIQIVLAFVLFFYLIGSLYDDRRDRSVLFWKSLPISDFSTVASKVITAAFTAPLLAFVVTVILQLSILIFLSLFLLLHGANPLVLWWPTELLNSWMILLVAVPINALWAMPTYGWLMLVSSFVRSRPFLWAVLVPVMIGVLNSVFEMTWFFNLPKPWYWEHIVGRSLGGAAPFSWIGSVVSSMRSIMIHGDDLSISLNWDMLGTVLLSSQLWIGVIVGLGLLTGAVYFRRVRIESQV